MCLKNTTETDGTIPHYTDNPLTLDFLLCNFYNIIVYRAIRNSQNCQNKKVCNHRASDYTNINHVRW